MCEGILICMCNVLVNRRRVCVRGQLHMCVCLPGKLCEGIFACVCLCVPGGCVCLRGLTFMCVIVSAMRECAVCEETYFLMCVIVIARQVCLRVKRLIHLCVCVCKAGV